eukprot:TRINITY_DN1040_c0_g1_i3.p1 TRINITY_DN1040_c0_g1~~TRINITY_DN1040_c0_g1_i3.p1  ORF type:complete len:830 (-),score=222.02 TRINITY_DN1040_c0_g1_i3:50-2539(-)
MKANEEDLRESVVEAGWGEVKNPKIDPRTNKPFEDVARLLELQNKAKNAKRGIWAGEAAGRSSIRKFSKHTAFEIFEKLQKKSVPAIVESVQTGSRLRLWVPEIQNVILVQLAGVTCPSINYENEADSDPFGREAKFVVERKLLHRDVQLTLKGIDKADNFTATVLLGTSNVVLDLLKNGLGRLAEWSCAPEDLETFKETEKSAKDKNLRVWTVPIKTPKSQPPKGSPKGARSNNPSVSHHRPLEAVEFVGKVVEIINAGTVTVIEDRPGPKGPEAFEYKINFSSLKVPQLLLKRELKEKQDKITEERKTESAWAHEAKEHLRKKLVGKTVRCVLDYVRPPVDDRGERPFWSLYLDKENIAIDLVERGYAEVVEHRRDDPRSPDYQQLVIAEKEAKKKGRGKWGPESKKPIHHVNDLTDENKSKAQQYLHFLQRTPKQRCVVEYVFAGHRLKLWIPRESCMISFIMSGIKCEPVTRNSVHEFNPNYSLGNYALHWTKERVFQHDVDASIFTCDKAGNFLGRLFVDGQDFAIKLLEEGLAEINRIALRGKDYENDYRAAEKKAKDANKNLWKDYDPVAEEEKIKKRKEELKEKDVQFKPESWNIVVTEILDGSNFYFQIVGAEAKALEDMMKTFGEQDFASLNAFTPTKEGQLVIAQFSVDGNWYRGVVEKILEDGFLIKYIDYGNSEIVTANKIRQLNSAFDLSVLPAQAKLGRLAFIRTPSEGDEFCRDAAAFFKELVWDKPMLAKVQNREKLRNGEELCSLILGDPETESHVNAELLRNGLARVERARYLNRAISALYNSFREEEQKAKTERNNIWQYGDALSDDEM